MFPGQINDTVVVDVKGASTKNHDGLRLTVTNEISPKALKARF